LNESASDWTERREWKDLMERDDPCVSDRKKAGCCFLDFVFAALDELFPIVVDRKERSNETVVMGD